MRFIFFCGLFECCEVNLWLFGVSISRTIVAARRSDIGCWILGGMHAEVVEGSSKVETIGVLWCLALELRFSCKNSKKLIFDLKILILF